MIFRELICDKIADRLTDPNFNKITHYILKINKTRWVIIKKPVPESEPVLSYISLIENYYFFVESGTEVGKLGTWVGSIAFSICL